MSNDNLKKKKEIDDILAKHSARMIAVKYNRDQIISDFLELLRKKKIEEIRNSLKQS